MTAALNRRSRPHLRPAPVVDPPYDDELPGAPGPRRSLWLVPPQLPFEERAAHDEPEATEFAPQPTPRSALPSPRAAAAALVQAVLEILAGRRPLQQIRGLTTEDVYDELACRLGALRALRLRRGIRTVSTPRLRSVHIDEPADGVAEVTAVIRTGERHRAVALRLEGVDGRWRCTTFELL